MKTRYSTFLVFTLLPGLFLVMSLFNRGPALAGNSNISPGIKHALDLPAVYNLTGGGTYCSGSPGLPIGLNGSESGVVYTLIKDNFPTLNTYHGNGQPFSFGLQEAGIYTVSATNSTGSILMNGKAVITEQSPPEVKIKASENRICSGTSVTFYAVADQAPDPVYQWYKTYTPVGDNEPTYTYTPAHGDLIQVTVTSGECTGFSDIFETIVFPVTSSINISCESSQVISGTPVTFIANLFNAGNNAEINWFVNNESVNEHSTEFTYVPENSDVIYATLTVGDDVPCIVAHFYTSNTIMMSVCDTRPQIFTLNSEGGYLCMSDYGLLQLNGSEPGVLYTVYAALNDTDNFVICPTAEVVQGTGEPIEIYVEGGRYKILASNACFDQWMDGICEFEYYNTSSPAIVSKNDILAGTTVTFSVPIWRQDAPVADYIWNRSNQESFMGETYTCIPENGDFIHAEMIYPCRDYDFDVNTVVMFVREPDAHYTTWTGNFSNDWHNLLNWDNGLPNTTSIVTIPETAGYFPTLTTPAICSSLIMSNSASFIGSEFLDVESVKITRDNTANQFQFISSPLANKTTWGNVFPDNQNSIWVREYWEGTGNWINHTTRNIISHDKGYSYRGLQSGKATFIGWLTQSEPTSLLLYNNTSNDIDRDGWNLMGNPYSCSIDWDLIPNNVTEAAVYAWNGYNYISWNGFVGALNQGILPPMSGFFVKALNRGYCYLQVPKTTRIHANEIQLKKADLNALLEIQVTDGIYDDWSYFRVNQEATYGFDKEYDARKLFGIEEAPQLYSETDGQPLSINEFPWEESNVEQHLCFNANIPGKYTLYFKATGLSTDLQVTFTDKLKEVSFNPETFSQYEFDYLPGENSRRFFIKLSKPSQTEYSPSLQAYAYNGIVHIINPNREKGELSVISVGGVSVFKTIINGDNHQEFNLFLPTGLYILQMKTPDQIHNVKVIL